MIPCFQPNEAIGERYAAVRAHTKRIFSLLEPAAFDARPNPLRHPIRFYEGHLAAFNVNQCLRAGLIPEDPQPAFSALFARGIDPADETAAAAAAIHAWPSRAAVAEYIFAVDRHVGAAMAAARRPDILYTCIEHEEMHQETLLALIRWLPTRLKRRPEDRRHDCAEYLPAQTWCSVPAGETWLGAPPEAPFGWDNEYPRHRVQVEAFEIASHKVTNADFLDFVEAGGYEDPVLWSKRGFAQVVAAGHRAPPLWKRAESAGGSGRWNFRGMFATIPMPLSWPVVVSFHEAEAYARWREARLPTEAEFQRAAFPGGELPDADRHNLEAASPWDFHAVGLPSLRPNRWGIFEMVGNGWEWTATVFSGFPGFHAMPHYPGYSADFFDGAHRVLKGAAPVTPRAHVRPSFRNWYRENYRFAFSTFRLVRDR